MYKVYIAEVIGAPSPTAIIEVESNIEKLNLEKLALETIKFLEKQNLVVSKIAVLGPKKEDKYTFKAIQVRQNNNKICFEFNNNCGNSMLAVARVIFENKEIKEDKISIINIDTNFIMSIVKKNNVFNLSIDSLIGKEINQTKIFENLEKTYINKELKTIDVTLIDVVNPYIIVNAKDVGIKNEEEILNLSNEDNENDEKLKYVKEIRDIVIEKYKFKKDSEFPKIAIVLNNNDLVARTIYLNNWHKGLPITAIITIAVASKILDSVIFNKEKSYTKILTANGIKDINIDIDDYNKIVKCEIYNIEAKGKIKEYLI